MQPELEQLFERLVFGPEIAPGDAAATEALLAESGLPASDREALRADFARLAVYRKLVHGTLREALEVAIPRTIARLGALFDEYFERFLREQSPKTHYLRDVSAEFLDFCSALWARDARVPGYALDLGRHEALRIDVAAQPLSAEVELSAELSLDRGLSFSEASRLVRYGYAVHRLSADEGDRAEPLREPTALFVYRSPEHEVRYLELTRVAAAILERLLSGQSLERALSEGAAQEGVMLDQQIISGTARLLADLAERGALLGPREITSEAAAADGHG